MKVSDSGKKRDVTLIVADVLSQNDFGRGIVKVDPEIMRELGLMSGDIVRIFGTRVTHARVMPSSPADIETRRIRMDKIIRGNSKVRTGEKVRMRSVEGVETKRLVLAPQDQRIRVGLDFSRWVHRRLVDGVVTQGDVVLIPLFGRFIPLVVILTSPKKYGRVTEATNLEVRENPAPPTLVRVPGVTYEDIGGLGEEIQRIKEMVELPLKHPELFRHLGIEPPKGVLLYGPPGTGKTLMAKAVANESGANFISINGPEIMSKYYGESEKKLRMIFEKAQREAPTVVFIDEIDSIAPNRNEVTGEVERRVVSQLLSLMDGLEARGDVIVVGATNRPEALDPALRRPGRFDREVELAVPGKGGRKEILQIHTRNVPLTEDVDLGELTGITYGFVGADLAALVREAAMAVLRRVLPKIDLESETIPLEIIEHLVVSKGDFMEAMKIVQPSAMREIAIEIPNVTWNDVGDLEMVKAELRDLIEMPLKRPKTFARLGIEVPKGILLYGPPGCGKTLLAKAVASESEANFISIKGPELLSKWVGESEKAVRKIFRKARQVAPGIIFIDEIDSLFPRRGIGYADSGVTERVVSQMLTELDGIQALKEVMVIGATNRPDLLDPALLRPGRLERLVYVPPPDREGRFTILKVHTKNMPLGDDVDLESIADRTEDFSGADLAAIVREAGLRAIKEDENVIEVVMRHFMQAMEKIGPSLTEEMVKYYEGFLQRIRSPKRMERDRERYVF